MTSGGGFGSCAILISKGAGDGVSHVRGQPCVCDGAQIKTLTTEAGRLQPMGRCEDPGKRKVVYFLLLGITSDVPGERKEILWYGKLNASTQVSEIISLLLHKEYFSNACYLLDMMLSPGALWSSEPIKVNAFVEHRVQS